ncbi:hypothetical protein SELMODRAFT_445715 [Selaginella moellendorffii]|uniref:CBS domain-containing protein n=1 Tax=Selaginella moellendorffii TaxID=88036 RepID=D8SKN8_SELML|nr:SNF1-related protein kinase regulatory subunit gamma-1 [Selaginella moellendorffii]EFJ15015.1 hypothetical protein SELMODRAFT_445715 [Selaginella moellendorffii]|eukprot:XP_002984003.1 SNF1-related protein kinase regulatory subunit gamma-1 [Selaginella moellendorffii]
MDIKTLEELVADGDSSLENKKEAVIHSIEAGSRTDTENSSLEPTEALKVFFDRVPLFSIPGIDNDRVVELEASDTMVSAITCLYKNKLLGAPVRDDRLPVNSPLADKYIGLVDFSGMVLWALQELEVEERQAEVAGLVITQRTKTASQAKDKEYSEKDEGGMGAKFVQSGFLDLIQQLDAVKSAKLGTLAQSFRWGPFLPVKHDDTLLHVLLLLSRHRLKAVPVIDSQDRLVRGFVTQNAAVQLLLQCSGLTWFDTIANKPLTELRAQLGLGASEVVCVNHDDVILDAMTTMWKFRISSVPVVERESRRLIGNVRGTDVLLMIEKPELFHQRRTLTVEKYMEVEAEWNQSDVLSNDVPLQEEIGASICAGTLSLGTIALPRMLDPVKSKAGDTLKQTMEKLVHARSDRSFVVDDKLCIVGVITLRDIINQFAPPLVEPPTQWSGFFESALQLTGSSLESPEESTPYWS